LALHGTGTVHRGTYREHATGNFLIINNEDIPHPAASFYLHGTGTSPDGSQIRSPATATSSSTSAPARSAAIPTS
jgi:hypothetical protein